MKKNDKKKGCYNHEKNEGFEDLRGQVHRRRVGKIVDDEAEDGSGAEKVVDGGVEPVARVALLPGPDLRVQGA